MSPTNNNTMAQQGLTLFSSRSETTGFRLDYFEIYNWGTFDKEIYRISPQGNNSLLTGANASGKSTLIDALLTLLVPHKRNRFYNQSSGSEKKGDRTEESYFFGNYGNQQREGSSSTSILRLRDRSAYSVILASFTDYRKDTESERHLTLFQVRYFSSDELKTTFGIAHLPLNIGEDFQDIDGKGLWRRRLDAKLRQRLGSMRSPIEFFNGPDSYAEKICNQLGLRSAKALTLFNQIVGVKVLDDLDKFIRTNMLEERPAKEKYIELRNSFQTLMGAKTNLDKVTLQIEKLEPIAELATKIEELTQDITLTLKKKDAATYFFTLKDQKLHTLEIQRQRESLQTILQKLETLKDQRESLEEEKSNLMVAIESDQIGNQIRALEREIKHNEDLRDKRQKSANKYNLQAKALELTQDPDSDDFDANRRKAKELLESTDQNISALEETRFQLRTQAMDVEEKIEGVTGEIHQLEQNKINISGRVAEIRNELLKLTGATKDEIPFIGELIRVKEDERKWEDVIERVLHPFGLSLIVPEIYYAQVTEYLDSKNLQGHLSYYRYEGYDFIPSLAETPQAKNSLLSKIEFKPRAPHPEYLQWIESEIRKNYNFACVDTLKEFHRFQDKVMTIGGLVKGSRAFHQKFDYQEFTRKHYVLGWENKEKIRYLKEGLRKLLEHQKSLNALILDNNSQINALTKKVGSLSTFLSTFDTFDDINWEPFAIMVQQQRQRKEELEKSNERVKMLQKQLANVKTQIADTDKQIDSVSQEKYKTDTRIISLQNDLVQINHTLEQIPQEDFSVIVNENPTFENLRFDTIEAVRKKFINDITNVLTRYHEYKTKAEREIANLINQFKNPAEEITNRFKDWRADVNNLPDSTRLELAYEYKNFLTRLKDQDIVRFRNKFNQYLRETITNNVSSFRMFFLNWKDEIRSTITTLNQSLCAIDFNHNPSTYIQLDATEKTDKDITEFVRMLEKAIPNLREADSTIDGRKYHFEQHIIPLINRLENEEWRKKVMDVRYWFSYKSDEYFRGDGKRYKTYQGMGELSGGEKAQLTYTILGAALAFQFGLTRSDEESGLRFIAIDEAFKAQDEDKARYLISLCKQLNLQLLVVTPADNLHIVENDISFVHYVERRGSRSVLLNMPIAEFKSERQKYLEEEADSLVLDSQSSIALDSQSEVA